MKNYISSKPTQYLINIFKTRFLLRNCVKYALQCQNGIFKKRCRATTVPYPFMWISPLYYVHNGSSENPYTTLTPDAEKHALLPFYSLNSKIGM